MGFAGLEWLRRKLHQSTVEAAAGTAKAVADYSVANQNYIVERMVSDNDVTRDEILNGIPSRVPSGQAPTVTGVISGNQINGTTLDISYAGKGLVWLRVSSYDTTADKLWIDDVEIANYPMRALNSYLGGAFRSPDQFEFTNRPVVAETFSLTSLYSQHRVCPLRKGVAA